ncbi:hypothetical protein ACET3Z_031558 [Daucus carota]
MSVRDNTDSSRGGGSSRGRGSYDSKLKGAIVPHPITPIQPVNLVNRYQVLGQIPKPYNTVLASKPPVIDPFVNTIKTMPIIQEKKVSDGTSSTLDVSAINKLTTSESNSMLKAIQARAGSLKKESSRENASESSYNSSQHSESNPYASADLQDAQDPYA